MVRWLTVPMFAAMVYEVVARYAFVAPTMWAYDISRMLYGALFMLGAGYALSKGVHIRADFILVTVNLQTAWLSPPVALSGYFLKGVVPE